MLSTPLIERATPEDLTVIAAMRAAEGWTENHWLLELVHEWDHGRFFVARPTVDGSAAVDHEHPRLIAATGAVAYGRLGFIGNVVVNAAFRRQGLGGHLMRVALEWLESQGVRRVELDATIQGRPVYQRLGFVGTEPSWVLWAPVSAIDGSRLAALAAHLDVGPLLADHLADISELDRQALGGDRLGLLQRVLGHADTTAYVARDGAGSAEGYLYVRPVEPPHHGLHLGPWIARTPAAAAALLRHALRIGIHTATGTSHGPAHVHACLPGGSHAARDLCADIGLQLVLDDLRMQLDLDAPVAVPDGHTDSAQATTGAPMGRPEWVYAMLSTMVG